MFSLISGVCFAYPYNKVAFHWSN